MNDSRTPAVVLGLGLFVAVVGLLVAVAWAIGWTRGAW